MEQKIKLCYQRTTINANPEGKFQFVCQWLKFSLFGEPTLEFKDDVVKAKKEKP